MKKTTWIIVAVAVIVLIAWWGNSKDKAPVASEPIKIGALLPLSGFAANYGDESRQGLEMARVDLEERFPNLPPIEIYYEDSFYTSKGAVDGYQKLTASNKLDAVIVGASQIAIPIKSLAEKDNVLEMAIWAGSPSYSEKHNLNYRTTLMPDANVPPILEYLKANKLNKIAILYGQNEFGVTYKESFDKLSEEKSVEVVLSEGFPSDANDFRTPLTKIKLSDVSAVFYVGTVSQLVKVLNQAEELNLKVRFFSQGAAEDQQLIDGAGENAEGLVYAYPFDYTASSAKEFSENYYKKYNRWPSQYVAESYVGLWLIGLAANACDNRIDVICWKNYLDNLKNESTIMGQGSIDNRGDLKAGQVFLKTIKNGQVVKLEN